MEHQQLQPVLSCIVEGVSAESELPCGCVGLELGALLGKEATQLQLSGFWGLHSWSCSTHQQFASRLPVINLIIDSIRLFGKQKLNFVRKYVRYCDL